MSTKQTTLTEQFDFEDPVVQISGDTLQVREMDAGQFLVMNQSKDSQYVVDDAGCSCPAYKYGNGTDDEGRCKHMRAVEQVEDDDEQESELGSHDCVDCAVRMQSYSDKGSVERGVVTILLECPNCGATGEVREYYQDGCIQGTSGNNQIYLEN